MSKAALWFLLLLQPACTWFAGNRNVLVTSEPPGARILVDGVDTGRTTPYLLDLGGMMASDHVITLTKPGFQPSSRYVTHHTEGYTSRWIDGAADMGLLPWPLFWSTGDTLAPFAVRWAHVPGELYVRLYKEGEPAPRMTPPDADGDSE